MDVQRIDVSEVGTALQHLIVRPGLLGFYIVITKGDEPLAWVTPARPSGGRARLRGSARGEITISDDFDDPLDEFAEYTQ
jgi:hypothetical protein